MEMEDGERERRFVWAPKTWESLKFKAEIPKTQLWSQKSQPTHTSKSIVWNKGKVQKKEEKN